MRLFNDLYAYRELLKTNVKKEIRGRYKGSFLGVLWSFINPLLQVLVYAIVFPYIMRNTVDNYLIFLVVGIIPWTFFTTCINQGIASIRANAGIIKKVYFMLDYSIIRSPWWCWNKLAFSIITSHCIITVYVDTRIGFYFKCSQCIY